MGGGTAVEPAFASSGAAVTKRQVAEALQRLHAQALGGERVNLLPALIEGVRAYATLGEMMGTVRIAYGQPYDPMGVLAPPRL